MEVSTSFCSRDSVKRWRASSPSDASGTMCCKYTLSEMSDVAKGSFSSGLDTCRWATGGECGTRADAVR